MAMVSARCTWVFIPFDSSRMRRLPVICGLRQQRLRAVAAESRVHAGDEIDGLIDPQPGGQHGDIGDETGLAHQRGALAETVRGPAHVSWPS